MAGIDILNDGDTGQANSVQSKLDRYMFHILGPRNPGDGVLSGGAPTTTGTDMDIDIAEVWVQQSGVPVKITAGAATLATAPSTAGKSRVDLVVIDTSTPSITVRQGTEADTIDVQWPALTAGDIVLCAVLVETNDTALATNTISDMRMFVPLIPQIEIFAQADSPATYTKPGGATFVRAIPIGGGGGGGGGDQNAAGNNRIGGGGGGGGGVGDVTFLAATVGATETVTIGSGGAGGTGDSGSGSSAGSPGGDSTFGSLANGEGGAGGSTGNTGADGSSGIGGGLDTSESGRHVLNSSLSVGFGGDSHPGANAGVGRGGHTGGGGGGGGISSGDTAYTGGKGGYGAVGGDSAWNARDGNAGSDGSGGEGGHGGNAEGWLSQGVNAGGAGGLPGGGGGGGGVGITGTSSGGAGGAGGDGRVVVMTW